MNTGFVQEADQPQNQAFSPNTELYLVVQRSNINSTIAIKRSALSLLNIYQIKIKSSIFLHALVGCLVLVQVHAMIGFDAAPLVSFQSTFDCLKSGGYGFANIRAFSVEGVDLDLSVKDTLIYAQRAGFKTDLFVRPCKGKSAKFQIDAIVLVIAEQYYDRFWLYLGHNPNPGCEWSSPHTNCDYVKTMIEQIKYFKKPVGIYVSPDSWRSIMGSLASCPELGEYPLIYPNYNNSPNFDDFVPFGGWKTPYGKVFQNNVTACGTTINKIYREGSANLQVQDN